MNVKIDFTRIDFELALEELSASKSFPAHLRNSSTCSTTVVGIVALYCLQEPIASSDPSILSVHLPILLSHSRVRQELCDKLFAHNEPTYDHLASIVKLIVQVAYQRLHMLRVRNTELVAPTVY